jgi:hypothetical protein
MFNGTAPTIKDAAEMAGLSVRTFQRRIAENGVGFQMDPCLGAISKGEQDANGQSGKNLGDRLSPSAELSFSSPRL